MLMGALLKQNRLNLKLNDQIKFSIQWTNQLVLKKTKVSNSN